MRTIDWDGSDVVIIDQTLLPHREVILRLHEVDDLAEAISMLRVRGAMALGVAGGLGIALAVTRAKERGHDMVTTATEAGARLAATRPTAVNLSWGINLVLGQLDAGHAAVVACANGLLQADIDANRRVGERGARLIADLVRQSGTGDPDHLRMMTHCNAGGLAGVEWGTALGVVRAAKERGIVDEVFSCETRPLLQGARLTAWELDRMGVPYRLLTDSAGPVLVTSGKVDVVVVGADRIAANGDTANKVGTFSHALAAQRAGIPFIVAAPEATIDLGTPTGADIPIEERAELEVLEYGGQRISPDGARAWNPAFDVTPADLITAIVTERRTIRPDQGQKPSDVDTDEVS